MKTFFQRRRRKIKKAVLSNVDVEFISLLFDDVRPANQKGAIIKSEAGNHTVFTTSRRFKSAVVGTQGLIYCTVMEPDTVDAHGDTYTAEEIAKAAHSFSAKGLVLKNDVNHNSTPAPEFHIAESYILKSEDKEHFPDTKVNSWVQVIKCSDLSSPLWQKVQKGQFNGVSLAGEADHSHTPDNTALIAELRTQLDAIKKAIQPNANEPNPAIETLQRRIDELSKEDASTANDALLKSVTKELSELSMSIKKAISKSLKGEPGTPHTIDTEVDIDGRKVIIKANKVELYKGIANVDSGTAMNILTPTTTSLFIDEVITSDPGDTLTDITVVPLVKDEKIDAGMVADLVFKNATDGTVSAQEIGTGDISCPTGILHAKYSLGRDVVEFYKDKYGEAAFGAYVEANIARKTEKAIRKLLFMGDRGSKTPALKALDGIVALAEDDNLVVDIDPIANVNWDEKFEACLLEFSQDVLEEMENFRFYVSFHDYIRITAEVGRRETAAGDKFLLQGGKLSYAGIPVKARFLPDNIVIGGLPKYIIIGYRTDAELKVEHHGSDWKYHWFIRIRPGITYVDGPVKVFNIEFSEKDGE